MHKHIIYILLSICLLASCAESQKKYVIGVSQCSEDSWRSKLQAELQQATYFRGVLLISFVRFWSFS